MPPASIMPQDGPAQQDGERAAGTRWLAKHAARVAPHGVTGLGDALSSNQPLWAVGRHNGGPFLLPCQPDSPPKFDERLALWQATSGMAERAGRRWQGRCTAVTLGRSINDVLLRGGDDALSVPGFAITVGNATPGAPLSHHSGLSHHRLTADHVLHVAQARRARWKIANEKHNGLQTKGSHREPNGGQGQQDRTAVRRSLTLLALLCHTVWEWSDDQEALLRHGRVRRQTFCHAIQA